MINIEVNTDGKKVHCSCEINIEGTKSLAIAEFKAVLDGLYKADKCILAESLKEILGGEI